MHRLTTAVAVLAITLATGCEAPTAADPPPALPPTTAPAPPAAVVYGKTIEERYPAKVVRIVDGDTLVVLNDANEQIKIRLEGIDTPEKGQPFGTKAKDMLGDLTFGKTATVAVTGQDWFGRTLGYIIADGVNANAAMIENGMAWHYVKYNKDEELAALQQQTQAVGLGLWADANPVAPWDWRAQKREEAKAKKQQQ